MGRGRLSAIAAIALVLAQAASSHEFWISGQVTKQAGASALALDFKVGQTLSGTSLPLIPDRIVSFRWILGGEGEIEGRLGDLPAAVVPFQPGKGAIISVRTTPQSLQHGSWETFLSYLEDEGLDGVAEEHAARGLPETGFFESFQRHAKIVHVPQTQNAIADTPTGAPLEILLHRHQREGSKTRLEGRVVSSDPVEGRLIKCLVNGPDGVRVRRLRTRADGSFSVLVPAFSHLLLNTVSMRPGRFEGTHWHSDWASLFLIIK